MIATGDSRYKWWLGERSKRREAGRDVTGCGYRASEVEIEVEVEG